MRKLIVHCGMPKTGTSVAQYFFNKLSSQKAINYFPEHKKGIAHHQLANDLIQGNPDAFIESVKRMPEGISLISSENLSNGFGREIDGIELLYNKIRNYTALEFIIVLRRMDSFIDSMYCQQVRFGKYSGDINDYALSRKRWIDNFFNGIGQAKLSMNDDLLLPIHGRNFNVVDFFADKLSVDKSRLPEILSGAPNTAKFSYKSQIILNNLDEFNDRYDVRINRSDMVTALSSGELRFEDDSFNYTFVDRTMAERILKTALESARRYNVSEYVEAFSDIDNLAFNFEALPMRFDVITKGDADLILSSLRGAL